MGRKKLMDMISNRSKQLVERLTEIAVEYLVLNTEFGHTHYRFYIGAAGEEGVSD